MKSVIRTTTFGVSRKRRLLRCGTALPLLLAAWPALAQPIVETSATDVVVDEASASGTPAAIDLRSTGGSITAQVDTVTATATAGQRNNVTNFDTAGGAISASLGTVTLTGEGELLGVRAVSQGGDIDVHVGQMTLDGAITSGVQAISADGNVTVHGDTVLLRGTGADVAGGFFPEGLLARSSNGSATVVAGTVETRGESGSAVVAVAGDTASVTVENAIAHSDGAVTVYAEAAGNATIDAGSVSMRGNGAGAQAISNGGSVAIAADSVDSLGGGLFGRGVTGVSLTAGAVDAVDYGLSGRSNNGGAVHLKADSVTVSGGTTIGLLARTTGDVTIEAGSVTVTGPGAFPGTRPDGYRFDQGGIVVLGEGGEGTIAIDAGTVSVAGEHRYGITARGNGAITISADEVTLASADSVAVVARGGAGDVSITTGAVTTTGASGVGVFGDTTTGDIVIRAGTTRVENTGFVGNFTGDAVVASSTSGNISITSESAYSAGLYGTAVAGFSEGDVSIDSGRAETTGNGGVAVYGSSTKGTLAISADEIVTSGTDTQAVVAQSTTGKLDLDVGSITATGANSLGILARIGTGGATIDLGSATTTGNAIVLSASAAPVGPVTVNITGDASSSQGRAIDIQTASTTFIPSALSTTVNVAADASLTGIAGIGLSATVNNGQSLPPQARSGVVAINNAGTITGTSGAALQLAQTNVTLTNRGTIEGDVIVGGGWIQNRGGTIDGDVTLNGLAGTPIGMFAYQGSSNGVTGTITGSAAIDTYAQIFTADGTAVIGGGLPTAFDRYGVVTDSADVTVIVETAANPVGGTPALMLFGEGRIVNRADLSASVVQGAPGTAPLVVPALYSFGFVPVSTPFGLRTTFEGAGTGPASFTNEADITGRIALTTSEFVNSGSITRSSAGVPSVVTARNGHAFSFSNTGTIGMTDGGNRVVGNLNGNPFNDFNPYHLPETALVIRSAVAGTLDAEGLYVPVEIANSGEIDGGLLVRMTASTFAFDNSGTISGFNGTSRSEPGLVIGLGRNWDAGIGDQQFFEPPATLATELATFTNRGEIHDGVEAHFIADAVEFSNSSLIAGNANNPDALFIEQSLEQDGADATSFKFVNTGTFEGNVGLELEAVTTTITNGGTIRGHEYVPSTTTFSEILFGGEAALEIDSETNGNGSLRFVNTGSVINTGHAASGVAIEVEAGDDDPDLGGAPVIGNASVAVVNSGTISATGGATVVPQQFATWLQPGQFLVNPLAALVVDATDVNGTSTISIENQAGGLIEAGGIPSVATPNGYSPITTAPANGNTVAVYASGKTINITNAGTIRGGAGTTPGPNVVYDGVDIYDGYIAGAIQTAGDEYGADAVYVASVDHVTNTATGTIVGSIDLGGNDDTLVNAGSITGNVFLRDGDDVLELHAGSIIDGLVDLGAGMDQVRLVGTGPNLGRVAATTNAELLDVISGSWLADGPQSEYGLIRVAQAARLIVGQDADTESSLATSHIALAGRLDLDLVEDTDPGELGGLLIEGAGSLHVTGTGTLLVDDATGLQHTGGTFVDNGELLLTTEFGGNVTTSGAGVFELAGSGDFTGDLVNNGTFVFSREDDYSFLGDFSGSGSLQKYGAGTLSFDGLYAFVGTTEIHAGLVKFTGQLAEDTEVDLGDGGTLDLSGIQSGQQTIAQLEGQGGTLQLGGTNLVIDQGQNTVFSGEISGSGTLEKQGEGDLKLEGDGTGFTGTGEVGGGTLSVNGDFSNASFVVNQGGTLGGRGTVGETSVNGGTLAPGNSIDTLTVNGNVAFTSASVFEVEVNAAGQGDRVDATGTATLGGARVQVIAENGTYRPLTDYTILTAAGGISGTFASVSDNLAFLDPSLIYTANAVTLRLVRNDIDFAAFGATPNQAAIGGLIESFGYGNTLYNETLLLTDGSVAPSFASLTGEVYPTHSAALIETAEMLRRQTADAAPKVEGAFLWATGLYNSVEGGGMDLGGHGVAGGLGYGAGGFTASAGLGLLDQGDGGADYLDGDLTFAVAHLGYDWTSGLSVSAGVQFGWADATTRRHTTLGTIDGRVSGEIEGDYLQLFGEIGYSLSVGSGLQLEPFAGISHVSLDLDPLAESGAATALAVSGIERDVTFADVGLRLSGDAGSGVRPFASAAYRHAWGDRASLAAVGFAGTAGSTLIGGLPVAESAAELSAGLVVSSGAVDFEVGYDGTISDTFDSHGVSAGIRFRF